jgi:hypothetical protein
MTLHIQGHRWLAWSVLGTALLHAGPVSSQEAPTPTVHWAYASYFGTGWYRIGDQQSAFVASLAPRWMSGDVAWLSNAGRETTYSVRVPITVGVARLDLEDVPGILDPDNFSTASLGLGADLDIPVSARLSVRPSAQLSYGTVLGESDDAWTYRGDLRARYTFEAGKLDWALIGMAGHVGYDASQGVDDSFSYAGLGAEFAYPVHWFSAGDSQTLVYWHLLYAKFPNRLEASGGAGQPEDVASYWQAGLAFGKKDERLRLWFLSFDRLGIAYDISPSGELRGIKFVFRSLYDP